MIMMNTLSECEILVFIVILMSVMCVCVCVCACVDGVCKLPPSFTYDTSWLLTIVWLTLANISATGITNPAVEINCNYPVYPPPPAGEAGM